MIIAIDGASKRNGKSDCLSSGVATIFHDNGDILLKSRIEAESTNQRGELNGLVEALNYGLAYITDKEDKDIIIVSDSQYLCDTITKDWISKWVSQDWYGSTGPIKNPDTWQIVYKYLCEIRAQGGDVYMNWTKGHLLAYSDSNIELALRSDPTGYTLFDRICTVANRPAEHGRVAAEFNRQRKVQGYPTLPTEIAVQWVTYNTLADCVASYMVKNVDAVLQMSKEAEFINQLSK